MELTPLFEKTRDELIAVQATIAKQRPVRTKLSIQLSSALIERLQVHFTADLGTPKDGTPEDLSSNIFLTIKNTEDSFAEFVLSLHQEPEHAITALNNFHEDLRAVIDSLHSYSSSLWTPKAKVEISKINDRFTISGEKLIEVSRERFLESQNWCSMLDALERAMNAETLVNTRRKELETAETVVKKQRVLNSRKQSTQNDLLNAETAVIEAKILYDEALQARQLLG
jgi:FPC/CPF motif-containing protein YcgG